MNLRMFQVDNRNPTNAKRARTDGIVVIFYDSVFVCVCVCVNCNGIFRLTCNSCEF